MTKNILFIVGSLRQGSYNQQLAQQTEKLLGDRANVSYLDYANIPFMNQDLETPVHPEIARIREAVGKADAIWLFSPVYNYGVPGPVKNLLDWLSRALDLTQTRGPSILQDKIITVTALSAGDAGNQAVLTEYRRLLPFIRTQLVEPLTSATINPEAWATGTLNISDTTIANLNKQIEALLAK